MAKMTLKIKVNYLYFQYQPQVSQDAGLVQIWWFQIQSVTNYCMDKIKFRDGQMDRQTGGRRQGQYPFGLKGQGVKNLVTFGA